LRSGDHYGQLLATGARSINDSCELALFEHQPDQPTLTLTGHNPVCLPDDSRSGSLGGRIASPAPRLGPLDVDERPDAVSLALVESFAQPFVGCVGVPGATRIGGVLAAFSAAPIQYEVLEAAARIVACSLTHHLPIS
jgi:hypothetical protein